MKRFSNTFNNSIISSLTDFLTLLKFEIIRPKGPYDALRIDVVWSKMTYVGLPGTLDIDPNSFYNKSVFLL